MQYYEFLYYFNLAFIDMNLYIQDFYVDSSMMDQWQQNRKVVQQQLIANQALMILIDEAKPGKPTNRSLLGLPV